MPEHRRRRAPRGEKTQLGVAHRRPQLEAGEKCGLTVSSVHDKQEEPNRSGDV